jgi:hypothetical protein
VKQRLGEQHASKQDSGRKDGREAEVEEKNEEAEIDIGDVGDVEDVGDRFAGELNKAEVDRRRERKSQWDQ